MEMARQLIDVAAEAGVDYVKFQTFEAKTLVSASAKKADYQSRNIGDKEESQFSMLKALELSKDQHSYLVQYCESKDVTFFSTAFDLTGLDYLRALGFPFFKVPSGEITNYPYLKKLSEFGLPVILSTGMSTLAEIKDALGVLTSGTLTRDDVTVLHCNTEYPTPMMDVNLLAMKTIQESLDVKVGYSDHTLGIEVPIAAVALGASVIEKHFTLSRDLPGPDHKASLEPGELKAMVTSIRNIEQAISGNGRKVPSISESKNLQIARKSIHINKNLPVGHKIQEADLVMLRPGDGISPMEVNDVIGKCIKEHLVEGHKLTYGDLI